MNINKKIISTILVGLMCVLISACGASDKSNVASDDTIIRAGALSGPTAMGLAKLMDDAKAGNSNCNYEFADLSTDPATFVAPLSTGEIDIAAIPANLASVVYNKTEGKVQVLAINTLSVLYIVERGDSISSIADLKDKTVYATGQGAVPEYTFRHLLKLAGLDPDNDLTIEWCADTTEALSYVTGMEGAIAMLPQPFATVAMTKVDDMRVALNLNEVWNELDGSCKAITGVIVARTAFVDEHPALVEAFLDEYSKSIAYLNEDVDKSAELIEALGIVPAPVAKKAIPGCNITFESGEQMKTDLAGFLQVICDENPQAVGGKIPSEDFYYIKK